MSRANRYAAAVVRMWRMCVVEEQYMIGRSRRMANGEDDEAATASQPNRPKPAQPVRVSG